VTGARAVLPAALALVLAGCVAPASTRLGQAPACEIGDDGMAADAVVLMAQSVPTASRVPCVAGLPLGWHFAGMDARNGEAAFWLDSDRDGDRAIEVRLTGTCDTDRATEIPSDRDGMRRYELVKEVTPRYQGSRFYLFEGGCLTLAFALSGENRGEPLALAAQAIDVLRRAELADQVMEESGGRLQLDPPADAGAPR
jgi:hypothetical protein